MALSLSRSQLLLVMFFFASTMTVLVLSEEDEEEGDDLPQPEPKVPGPGENITVYEGQDIKVHCGITDLGHLGVNWKYNKTFIAMGEYGIGLWRDRASSKNLTLKVTNAKISDTGFYSCIVMTEYETEQLHYVNVKAPSVMIEPKSPIEMESGGNLKLTCKTDHGPYEIKEITWKFQDNPLQQVPTNRILQIKSVTADNSGNYKCVVKLSNGLMLQAKTTVTVVESPKMTSDSESINAMLGEKVTLRCDHTGPKPQTITWYFNDQPYHDGHGLDEIILTDLQESQTGEYRCVLNGNEKLSKRIKLQTHQYEKAKDDRNNKSMANAPSIIAFLVVCLSILLS